MTTVTRRHAAGLKARAKKAIAVVSAGALVASLGYFHLWGSTPAVAANDADRVEVLFNLDSDVIVEVGGETFDAQSESGYLASVADDLRFKTATAPSSSSAPAGSHRSAGSQRLCAQIGGQRHQRQRKQLWQSSAHLHDQHDAGQGARTIPLKRAAIPRMISC